MDVENIQTLVDVGQTAVFIYLYMIERRRVKEVQEARIAECKSFVAYVQSLSPPYPTDIKDTPR
jgi:hypothetical protein